MSVVGSSVASMDAEISFADGSGEPDAVSETDISVMPTKDIELRQKAVEERYSEQMAELKKAEDDLHSKEELYRHEDEARLEKLTAQNSFVEKLDVRKMQLMYFIDAQQRSMPAGIPQSLTSSLSLSDGHLNEVYDGWQEQTCPSMPRTVLSATGRLLTTSKHKNPKDVPAQNGTTYPDPTSFSAEFVEFQSKQQHREIPQQTGRIAEKVIPAHRTAFERPSDLCLSSVPWRLLSDDPDVKSRSASAPRLSDEMSASSLCDEAQLALLRRLARSPSPRTTRLSNLSLVSVPESIHEEREESPISGRLSISDVDIRRHRFAAGDIRNRWSLDEEQLSAATSVRCPKGSDQDVVVPDSGLPSSPEAGHLDSSVSSDMNTTRKRKEKTLSERNAPKSRGKPELGILQKLGATLTSLRRRQDTKATSVKKQKPIVPLLSKLSHRQPDTVVVRDSHPKRAGDAKVQSNANGSKKPATDQARGKSKQPVSDEPKRYLMKSKSRITSDSAEKKSKSASSAQGKPIVPTKVRESFRSFRERLKLTAGKRLKRKSGEIPVEIFLPKPKVAESGEDGHDLYAVEEQIRSAAVDACLNDETVTQHMSSDIDWTVQWPGRYGESRAGDEKLKTVKGPDEDCELSDDSLNDQKISSYNPAAGLHYGDIIGPDGQFFHPYLQESARPAFSYPSCDDGSFSEDSLAEDDSSGLADRLPRAFTQQPRADPLPCNTHRTSPTVAVPHVARSDDESEMNGYFDSSADGFVSRDVVELEQQQCALYVSSEAECKQSVVLSSSDLQIAPVLRDDTSLQSGAVVAAHLLNDDSSSALASG